MSDRRTHSRKSIGPQQGCHCQHCDRKRVRDSTIELQPDKKTATFGEEKLLQIHPENEDDDE